MEEKECPRCNEIKAVSEFYRDSRAKSGLKSYCKQCCKDRWKQYVSNPESPRALTGPRKYVDQSEKYCGSCKTTKPIEEFSVRTERKNGRRSYCKLCEKYKHSKWRDKNPSASRERNLVAKYGIDLVEYENILESQGGGCAICGVTSDTQWKYMPVDHCHESGKVRGILCTPCNKGLGLFGDDSELLEQAAEYLKRNK